MLQIYTCRNFSPREHIFQSIRTSWYQKWSCWNHEVCLCKSNSNMLKSVSKMAHNPSAKFHFEETGRCVWLCHAGFSDLIRILAVPSLFLSPCQRETLPHTNHGVDHAQLCRHKSPPVKRRMRALSQALSLARMFLHLCVLLLTDLLFWGEAYEKQQENVSD